MKSFLAIWFLGLGVVAQAADILMSPVNLKLKSSVGGIAFSQNEKILVTVDHAGTDLVSVWDLTTLEKAKSFECVGCKSWRIESVTLSPDGKTVVIGTDEDLISVNLETQKETVLAPSQKGFAFYNVDISPNGKYVAATHTVVREDGYHLQDATVWNMGDGSLVTEVPASQEIEGTMWGPDSSWFLTTHSFFFSGAPEDKVNCEVQIHDLDGKVLRTLEVDDGGDSCRGIDQVQLSVDQKHFYAVTAEGGLTVWSAETFEVIRHIKHKDPYFIPYKGEIAPDLNTAVLADRDTHMVIVDLNSGAVLFDEDMKDGSSHAQHLIDQSGQYIYDLMESGVLFVRNLLDGAVIQTIETGMESGAQIVQSTSGDRVAVSSGSEPGVVQVLKRNR